MLKLQKYVAMSLLTVGAVMAQDPSSTGTKTETVSWGCRVNLLGHLAGAVTFSPSSEREFTSENVGNLKDNLIQVSHFTISDAYPRMIRMGSSSFTNSNNQMNYAHKVYIRYESNGYCAQGWIPENDGLSVDGKPNVCTKELVSDPITTNGLITSNGRQAGIIGTNGNIQQYKLFFKVIDDKAITDGQYNFRSDISVSPNQS